MDYSKFLPAVRGGLAVLLLAGAAATATAATVWQQDWDESGDLLDPQSNHVGGIVRAIPNGDFFIAQGRGSDVSLVRLSAGGGMQWQQSIARGAYGGLVALVALADGSAAQLQSGSNGNAYLTRMDASGQVLWGLGLPAQRLASVGTSLVAGGCANDIPYVTGVDAASGSVRWQRALSTSAMQCTNGILAAGAADVYAGYPGPLNSNTYYVTRLNSQGQTVWTSSVNVATTVRMALNGNNIYVLGANTLSVFRSSDGAALWQGTCLNGPLHFVGTDPLCAANATTVRRLAASSGSQVWSHAVSGGSVLGVFEDNVYYRVNDTWQRWAGSTGVTQWQAAPLAAVSAEHPEIWRSSAGTIAFLGAPPDQNQYLLKRYRLSDGVEIGSAPLPTVTRGISRIERAYEGGDFFLRSNAYWSAEPERLRRVAADSGNVIWETRAGSVNVAHSLTVTASRLYLAQRDNSISTVRSLDRATGAPLWSQRILATAFDSNASAVPRLAVLQNGDIAALNAFVDRLGSQSWWPFREVHKTMVLAGGNGSPVWDRDVAEQETEYPLSYNSPPSALAYDDDLIIGPAISWIVANLPLQRVDALSGTPVWSVSPAHDVVAMARTPGEQAFFAFGEGRGSNYHLNLSKHDANTGAPLWQYTYGRPSPSGFFELHKLLALPDGDVLVVGNVTDYSGPVSTSSGRVLRIKGDGSGLRYAWTGGTDPSVPTDDVADFVIDAAGKAWLYRRQSDDRLGAYFLSRFDLEQGRVTGSQIYRPAYAHPLFPVTYWDTQLMPYQGEQMLASGSVIRPPLPSTQRIALRDFSVVRRGDLAVELSTLPASFSPGTQLPLSARVSYNGDGPITGAVLMLDPVWHGTAAAFTCSGEGVSNCSVESRFGQIVARFDAQPGARLRLAGQVRSLVWPAAADVMPRAVVYGPDDLLESDTVNNLRSVSATQPIFADGFQ